MQIKNYAITLDMIRTIPFRPFEVVEGDTGNVLHITLLNNGDPMDLSDCNVCVAFASSAGFAMQDETSGVVKTEQTGSFDITLLPTAYGAGNVSADVQVYSGGGMTTLITSTRFDFRCRRTLVDGEILRASSAYPPLIEAARVATEAAQSALAAAARVDTNMGEINVQADWNETDAASDAYIRSKPVIGEDLQPPTETLPAESALADEDALPFYDASAAAHRKTSWANLVSALGNFFSSLAHASRHAKGGSDALAAGDIGAAALLRFTAAFAAAGWADIDVVRAETDVSGGAAGISAEAFVSAVSGEEGAYAFVYDGAVSAWKLDGAAADLSSYGLTLTGTPGAGDTIGVEYRVRRAQSVPVADMSAVMVPKCDLLLFDGDPPAAQDGQRIAWSLIDDVDSGDGAVTLTCFEDAPEADFTIQMEVIV